MFRRLLPAVAFAGTLLFAAAHPSASFRVPLQNEGQEPPPPDQPPAPSVDAEAIVREVQAFYAEYRQAWDERNTAAIANHLAGDFVAYQYSPQGVVQIDKVTSVAGVQRFFDTLSSRETMWTRSVLAVVPRSPTEAVAAVRNDFSLRQGGGDVELTLEVLRKGKDGRWRLARKWSERSPF